MVPSVPPAVVHQIETHTGSLVQAFTIVTGGCINNAGMLRTSGGVFFLKWNDLHVPGMFEAEGKGLALLRKYNSLVVPQVVLAGTAGKYGFILLEYIKEGPRSASYWKDLALGLARLHRATTNHFGLEHDNYIGSLQQDNSPSSSWIEFFVERRLKKQLRLAEKNQRLQQAVIMKFEKLFDKLPSLLPEEAPSLLHGDLWAGNIIVTTAGAPCLIDPAVYYGHREVDIAMTQLFGGFDGAFLDAYHSAFPLGPGFQERLVLYNLYPLLVHVNLFGGGYASQVDNALSRFV